MPIFEYTCSDCGSHFEKLQWSNDSEGIECPSCTGANVNKLFSRFGVGRAENRSFAEAASSEMAGGCCGEACGCR
ncbi:MAG: FmdB family zinc ribbon protein [bacterium]